MKKVFEEWMIQAQINDKKLKSITFINHVEICEALEFSKNEIIEIVGHLIPDLNDSNDEKKSMIDYHESKHQYEQLVSENFLDPSLLKIGIIENEWRDISQSIENERQLSSGFLGEFWNIILVNYLIEVRTLIYPKKIYFLNLFFIFCR